MRFIKFINRNSVSVLNVLILLSFVSLIMVPKINDVESGDAMTNVVEVDSSTLSFSDHTEETFDNGDSAVNIDYTEDVGEEIEETVETEPKPLVYFDSDLTFDYEYVEEEGKLPYHLYSSSIANESAPIPLIVWLHGSGECLISQSSFVSKGLPYVLKNWDVWKTENLNAYFLCPQLTGELIRGSWDCYWNLPRTVDAVKEILDDFIPTHNVDTSRIYIMGHSLGGQGSLYLASYLSDYFAACVALSPYRPGSVIYNLEMPIRLYVGTVSAGEDEGSINYANSIVGIVGSDNLISVSSSHGNLPIHAFRRDKDQNGRSDLFEWLFAITKIES